MPCRPRAFFFTIGRTEAIFLGQNRPRPRVASLPDHGPNFCLELGKDPPEQVLDQYRVPIDAVVLVVPENRRKPGSLFSGTNFPLARPGPLRWTASASRPPFP